MLQRVAACCSVLQHAVAARERGDTRKGANSREGRLGKGGGGGVWGKEQKIRVCIRLPGMTHSRTYM